MYYSQPGSADFAQAEAELTAVAAHAGDQVYSWEAQAHGGLARAALAPRQPGPALACSERSLAPPARVVGAYDVRIQTELWLIHSEALLATGDAAGARDWARKARAASLRTDEPASPAIAAADAMLLRATRALAAPADTGAGGA